MRQPNILDSAFQPSVHTTLAAVLLAMSMGAHAIDPKASKYFEDASIRYEKKDIEGAIIQLKNALQVEPTLLPVHVLLGKALLKDGQVVAAEVALQEALRLGVNRAEIVLLLAQSYLAQGKQKLIFEQQQFLLAGLPPGVQLELLLLRASAASDLGDARGALKAVEDARAIDANAPGVWLAEVPIRIRTRQFAEANAAADRGLALAAGSAEAWYQKGSVLHVMGDLKAALAAYDKAIGAMPEHLEALTARTGIYVDLGRNEDAKKDLDVLKRVAPKEPRAAYLRALLAERSKNPAAASAGLKEVAALIDPVPMDFLRYRPQLLMLNGLSHFGLGQREKAKTYLLAFQKVQGNSPASKLLAQILFTERDTPKAIEVLEKYLQGQPGDAQAMTLLAAAHLAEGRNAKASALMQEALKARDTPDMRTVLGISMIRGGQSADGVSELDAVFRKNPKQVQAGLTLINTYMRSGQAAKASAIAETLTSQFPSNAAMFNLLGMTKLQTGNAEAAKAAFEQALKLDDKIVAAKLNLARAEISSGAFDAATVRLAALLKADEKSSEAMYEMSVISERQGKKADAQRWLEKANDASGPKDVRWGLALLDYFLRAGQPDLALKAAKQVSGKAPEDLDVLMAYGRAQLANGDSIGAKSTLTAATRFADYNPPKQVEIARLQLAANNLDGAAYSLDKALSGQPDFLPAMVLMANVEIRKKDPVKAEKWAREVVGKSPKRSVGYSLLGDVANARGLPGVAVEHYRRAHQTEPTAATFLQLFMSMSGQDGGKSAIALAEQWVKSHPKDLASRKALGDAYARAGSFSQARSNYEAVLQVAPDNVSVLNNLANALMRLRDPGALKIAEQAVAKAPSDANALDTLAWILFQEKQADRALTLLRDARLRDPNNPEIRYHLGAVLAQAGRSSAAREELEGALKLTPSFPSAGAAKALLQTLK